MAKDFLLLFAAVRLPLTLWGPVGARKTRTVESLNSYRDERGVPYRVLTIQPSTEDPTVIHGMRYTADVDGKTLMLRAIPDIVQMIVDYSMTHYLRTDAHGNVSEVQVMLGDADHDFGDDATYEVTRMGGLTIIFADEMTTCMPAQQHAMLGMLTHGKFGDMDISHLSTFIMAANPENTVSTVIELGEQVINRGGHLAWYGDVEVFLEEWTSGWNGATTPPNETEQWFITELLNSAPKEAFRSAHEEHEGGWTTDKLVPYHLFEHSERVTTDLGRMITLINDVFEDAPDDVRRAYIVEATRALMGNKWAVRMDEITRRESRRVTARGVIDAVRRARISLSSTKMDLLRDLGHSLHRLSDGSPIQRDQAEDIMTNLIKRITPTPTSFSRDALVAAWAFAASAESTGQTMALHKHLVRIVMDIVPRMIADRVLDREEAIAKFFEGGVREELRKSVAAEQARRQQANEAAARVPAPRVPETAPSAPAPSDPAPAPVTASAATPSSSPPPLVLSAPLARAATGEQVNLDVAHSVVAVLDPVLQIDGEHDEDEIDDSEDEDDVEIVDPTPAEAEDLIDEDPLPIIPVVVDEGPKLKPLTTMMSSSIFDDD